LIEAYYRLVFYFWVLNFIKSK